MDRRFLKEIAEGYITNHDVFSEFKPKQVDLIRETVYNDLCEVCDELRDEDEPFYNDLYFSNRFYQNDVFENYLNIRYKSKNVSLDENGEVIDESLAGIGGAIGSAIGSGISGVGSLIGQATTYILTAPLASQLILYGLLIVAFYKFNGIVSKQFFKFLYKTGNTLRTFGKFIETSGKSFQLRYAVIQKNFDHCYKRAGVENLNSINALDYFNKYSGTGEIKYKVLDQKKANTLANCYVETTIDIIKLQMRLYLNCIKSTTGYSEMSKLNTSEFMAYLQSDQYKQNEFNLEITCFEYYKIASEQIAQFDDLLEYFYKDSSKKRQMTLKLIGTVEEARNEVARVQKDTRSFSKFKTNTNPKGVQQSSSGGFQKKPYNKKKY